MSLVIRPEAEIDHAAIDHVIETAFFNVAHSDQTEAHIVRALRRAGALSVSRVAIRGGVVVGYVAFSPVQFAANAGSWFGLAPVSVLPEYQRQGIARALIEDGLDTLRRDGAKGCVLLGEPDYYSRFGFQSTGDCYFQGAPLEYFQVLPFADDLPAGEAIYHPAFYQ